MKYFRPVPNSKTHLAKVQKALDRHEQTVSCAKCGAVGVTLRKLPLLEETIYCCENCIRQAMTQGKDVREGLVKKEEDMKKTKKPKVSEGQIDMFDIIDKDLEKKPEGEKKC